MTKRNVVIDSVTGVQWTRACAADRRFSYSLYVPGSWSEETASSHSFLVAMHGTGRAADSTRDLYIDLAEDKRLIILAPLFPTHVTNQNETHNFTWIRFSDIRYDHILFAMLEEASQRYGVSAEKFSLTGYSAGGGFAHRMLYLHANRLSAVSIGASGFITQLDAGRKWFVGIQDVEEVFGKGVEFGSMKNVPVQVVVGGDDTHPEINVLPGSSLYMEGINYGGTTRVERARALHNLLIENGVHSQFDIVPGAVHSFKEVALAVDSFFRKNLP
jgi:poly(3-hydroxybutyrate) depolymerase